MPKYVEPHGGTMNIKTIITLIIVLAGGGSVSFATLKASNEYTDKELQKSEVSAEKIAETKLNAIKDDIQDIKKSVENMEVKQDKLIQALTTKR